MDVEAAARYRLDGKGFEAHDSWVIVRSPGRARTHIGDSCFRLVTPGKDRLVESSIEVVEALMAIADDVRGDLQADASRAGETLSESATVEGTETARSIPSARWLEIVA